MVSETHSHGSCEEGAVNYYGTSQKVQLYLDLTSGALHENA